MPRQPQQLDAVDTVLRDDMAGSSTDPAAAPNPSSLGYDRLATLTAVLPEFKLMVGVVTAGVLICALYFGRDIFIPLALAVLLSFVLDPLVVRLKRWGLPRAAAVIVIVVMALSLLGLSALFLGSQVRTVSAQLPTYQSNIKDKLRSLRSNADRPGMFDGLLRTVDVFRAEVDLPPVAQSTAGAPRAAAQRVQVVPQQDSAFQQALGWLEAGSGPLVTAGIVFVFVVLILLDRLDLRDRMVRLWGGSLHRSTDAMDEAGARITRYLTMQLVINLSYGVPMATGLWLIGVPGAVLWGATAAVMRFVPYVGPMISSVFPLALAFALDPGWTMVLWTLGLIVALELLSHNLVEPWLYGASTGLSAISLMVSATFWTALWGPLGLIMSTPLTVCLLVIGRYLPRLQFLDVLLGSQPALDTPTRIYQRLLAGDVEDAIELAGEQLDSSQSGSQSGSQNGSLSGSRTGSVMAFYNETGMAVLRMATLDHASVATAEHRHRVVMGMSALLDDLGDQHAVPDVSGPTPVVCIGGKWEMDTLAARMLAHALSLEGQPAQARPVGTVNPQYIERLDLRDATVVCLSYFSPQPQVQARHFCRRLKRRWPDVQIVLALWNAPPELLGEDACRALGADAVATSLSEAVIRVASLAGANLAHSWTEATVPEADAERLNALQASGALDPRARPLFDAAAKRAADVFDLQIAMVSLIAHSRQDVRGVYGLPLLPDGDGGMAPIPLEALNMPRGQSLCGHVVANGQTMVVPDLSRDIRFAANPVLQGKGVRFYAGAPLRDAAGHVLGTLCLLDPQPHSLNQREVRLLEAMAGDLMANLRQAVLDWGEMAPVSEPVHTPPSATVGQLLAT